MRDVVLAIIGMISGIVMLVVLAVTLGLVLDNFYFEFLTTFTNIGTDFQGVMNTIMKLGDMFGSVMIIGAILLIVWVFKVVIKKLWYTRPEEEERW